MVVSRRNPEISNKAVLVDSYVIRIYRRDAKNPANIAGQIEFVEKEETRLFGGVEELVKILTDAKKRKLTRQPQELRCRGSKPAKKRRTSN